MINFRFHLISLVAVFLALGVGVAMGASFVDRATVDSLRGRVDDLDEGYRRRGVELDATRDQLGQSDSQAAALAGEGSEALADRLTDVPVVVLATEGVSGDLVEDTRTSLGAAGADLAGTVRLQPALTDPADSDLAAARQRFGLRGNAADVRTRLATDLGVSLALLSAVPPEASDSTTTQAPTGDAAIVPTPTDAEQARAYIGALSDLGMLTVADTDTGGESRFPLGSGFRYVLIGGADEDPDAVLAPLATAEADRAPRTLTVAEARPARPTGEATTTTADQPARGSLVESLRGGEVADALSTVDDLEEAFGRIAAVYAVAEQRDTGRVGHYGTGTGATAPFPTVPAS
ncbi:copper transporter [Dermatobacter hominis]|uniref:copper transporter n=1 Tax=Dermatobacter hominis TaxID=2884263 RepID=UPI001D11E346|nr:copper transporter [Dermatobacter hominis]UDY36245.1 copper transporter [Dermatobacter hominis]